MNECLTRRAMLRAGVDLTLAALTCPLLAACGGTTEPADPTAEPTDPDDAVTVQGTTVEVDLTRVLAFSGSPAGEVAALFRAAQVIVVRRTAAEYRAFSAVCPHAGCGVSVIQPPRLVCPCHGSAFDFAGRRLEGPAPTGLDPLPLELDVATQRLRVGR